MRKTGEFGKKGRREEITELPNFPNERNEGVGEFWMGLIRFKGLGILDRRNMKDLRGKAGEMTE